MIHHVSKMLKDKRGTYFEVFIERKGVLHVVLVDSADYFAHVQGKSWGIHKAGTSRGYESFKFYARMNVGPRSSRKSLYLHRVVTGAPKGLVPDHGDSNGLNCRQYNLALTTQKDNAKRQVHHKKRK